VWGAVKEPKDASTKAEHHDGLGVILNRASAYSHMDSSCSITQTFHFHSMSFFELFPNYLAVLPQGHAEGLMLTCPMSSPVTLM
jgi:hypothetical protein